MRSGGCPWLARDQLALCASLRTYGNLSEATIRRQFNHESFVVGDGRLWIPRAFYIGIVAPMRERPASAKFHVLYAKKVICISPPALKMG